jgi:hypothetical protein
MNIYPSLIVTRSGVFEGRARAETDHLKAKSIQMVERPHLIFMSATNITTRGPDPGLCGNCQHARTVESDRGSTFYMCELSFKDRLFPKYPPLPVLTCSGYTPNETRP